MSHQHTPVSSSVIKSTLRFAPKAVPRKKQSTNVPPPRPTPAQTVEENDEDRAGSQSEAESRIDPSLQVTQPIPRTSQRRVDPIDETPAPTSVELPTLEPSISPSGITPRVTLPTISSTAPS